MEKYFIEYKNGKPIGWTRTYSLKELNGNYVEVSKEDYEVLAAQNKVNLPVENNEKRIIVKPTVEDRVTALESAMLNIL